MFIKRYKQARQEIIHRLEMIFYRREMIHPREMIHHQEVKILHLEEVVGKTNHILKANLNNPKLCHFKILPF
jgi:hypothetical protein